jgi:hypothetical protein
MLGIRTRGSCGDDRHGATVQPTSQILQGAFRSTGAAQSRRTNCDHRTVPEAGERDPTLDRAVESLVPFAQAWHLPLNPEDLELIASVVLEFSRSDRPQEEIGPQVTAILEEERVARARMYEAWLGKPVPNPGPWGQPE